MKTISNFEHFANNVTANAKALSISMNPNNENEIRWC